jgi:hypothetical protein
MQAWTALREETRQRIEAKWRQVDAQQAFVARIFRDARQLNGQYDFLRAKAFRAMATQQDCLRVLTAHLDELEALYEEARALQDFVAVLAYETEQVGD